MRRRRSAPARVNARTPFSSAIVSSGRRQPRPPLPKGEGRGEGKSNLRRVVQTRILLIAIFVLGLGLSSASAESLLLSGATVHTVSGETLSPGHVLIRDDKIVSVTPTAPGGADRTVDLQGLHLYPGLIDADTILGLNEIAAVRATVDNREVGDYTAEVEAWVSVNPDSELIPVARANGITHVNVVPSGGVVAGQSSLIQLAGWTVEDHAVERRTGLHVYWPSMQLNTSPDNKKSLPDQDRERKEAVRSLDSFFDEASAYAKARAAGRDTFTKVPAWEAMLPYVNGERPVFIHADELRQLQAALKWIERRRLKAVLAGGREAWQMANELAASKVPLVFDAVHTLPGDGTDGYDAQYAAAGKLAAAGVKLALSLPAADRGRSKMQESHARNLPYEAAQALAYGLPADVALKSITLHAAEILGVADRLGSIEPGKEATLIAVDGDLLDIRSNVKHVWIDGREASLESRHTRLYQKYRDRPPP